MKYFFRQASQALESERESVVTCLYKFLNQNASSIRTILVARCPVITSENVDQRQSCHSDVSDSQSDSETGSLMENSGGDDSGGTCQPLPDKLSVECTESHTDVFKTSVSQPDFSVSGTTAAADEAPGFAKDCRLSADGTVQAPSVEDEFCDKYLIFTMGEQTYTPHQIGIKRIAASEMKDTIDRLKHRDLQMVPNNDVEPHIDKFDGIDHSIELHGHIIGMCLSPDHRYAGVFSLLWPPKHSGNVVRNITCIM